ncbi:hypothetical protein [Hyunsoonleella pacifica]|uniref:Uncharacterized protein n=1 Tax=Hyunsoonleella pacifica TaxID=1080224 RepID=A0A4Q9FSN6_9FLAO|nr:hypothetical protein [Hyunsoonleella pacifica]TBN18987.1 hypothetical protein EYD46_02675 [Hyunsoonleella pacifica]GGD06398.1 hypothetical protein GCM10011368_05330 [Hyunsoonleella pacifica]
MKNLGSIILGFIIGALLTYFFCPRPTGDDMHSMDRKIRAPKDTISVVKATQLFKNWQRNNPTEIDSTLEVEGSRKQTTNVAWSLDVVRDYLDYAEAAIDSSGYKMTGIAVFMGNYGKNSDPKIKNRNTLFIAPTVDGGLSKASIMDLVLQSDPNNKPPLNAGSGGNGGYPQ